VQAYIHHYAILPYDWNVFSRTRGSKNTGKMGTGKTWLTPSVSWCTWYRRMPLCADNVLKLDPGYYDRERAQTYENWLGSPENLAFASTIFSVDHESFTCGEMECGRRAPPVATPCPYAKSADITWRCHDTRQKASCGNRGRETGLSGRPSRPLLPMVT